MIARPLPAAVLWDMDGTIVATEDYWIASEMELVEQHGGQWTHDDGLSVIGSALSYTAVQLRERGGVQASDEDIIEQLLQGVIRRVREHGLPWRPGAAALLAELRSAGVPCALVTMSYASLAAVIAEVLPDGTFATLVTGDQVTNGKPHPEPYETAATRLGVAIEACIAFEDSVTGLTSAESAGARVVGVPFLTPIPAAAGRSRLASLEQVTLDDLRDIMGGKVIDRSE